MEPMEVSSLSDVLRYSVKMVASRYSFAHVEIKTNFFDLVDHGRKKTMMNHQSIPSVPIVEYSKVTFLDLSAYYSGSMEMERMWYHQKTMTTWFSLVFSLAFVHDDDGELQEIMVRVLMNFPNSFDDVRTKRKDFFYGVTKKSLLTSTVIEIVYDVTN